MTGKIVNLNKARKAKARDNKRTRADENAIKYGRSKSERTLEQSRSEKAARTLDGHKRDP